MLSSKKDDGGYVQQANGSWKWIKGRGKWYKKNDVWVWELESCSTF